MVADAGTDGGEGIGLPDDPVGLFVFPPADVGHVSPCLGPQRAGRLARRAHQLLADEGIAPFVVDMPLVLLAEVAQRTEHGIGRGLSQAAHRRVRHHMGQFLEKVQVLQGRLALGDVIEDLVHALGALPARKALSAGLVLQEVHEVLGHVHHAGVFVHDDHAARSHDGACFHEAVVVDGQVEHPRRDAASGRPARLDGLDLRAARRPAADVVNHLRDLDAERDLHQSGVLDLSHQGEDLGARVSRHADPARRHAAPRSMITGMLARVSTLLMQVGCPPMPFSMG